MDSQARILGVEVDLCNREIIHSYTNYQYIEIDLFSRYYLVISKCNSSFLSLNIGMYKMEITAYKCVIFFFGIFTVSYFLNSFWQVII